jgi:Zn-dependent protease with chaperone function
MNVHFLVPFFLVVACLGSAWFLPRFLAPSVGVATLTVSVGLATLVTILMFVQLGGAGISELPFVSDALGWCRALYGGDHGAPPVLGIAATLVFGLIAARMGRYVHRVVQDRQAFGDVDGVEVISSDQFVAFAVPGPRGGVVLSDSLLSVLDRNERSVILAHENAHLRHRHHLYIYLVEMCAAGLPLLRPFARKVKYLTERWADEVAAERVGSRDLVATTIARVALLPSSETRAHALSIGGGNVVTRVEALVAPLPATSARTTLFGCFVVTAALLGLTLQLHHLVDFITHAGH